MAVCRVLVRGLGARGFTWSAQGFSKGRGASRFVRALASNKDCNRFTLLTLPPRASCALPFRPALLPQVLAGALKDNGRGTIVGETTFGKGLIQTVVNLSDGSGLAVTVAKYQTPSGEAGPGGVWSC